MSLVSMIIADRIESLTRYYDRWMNLITGGQDRRVRDAVLSYVEPGDLVLDVGCGTGTLAIKAAQKRAQVIGIDQSPAMLKLAREKAQASGVEVDFRIGSRAKPAWSKSYCWERWLSSACCAGPPPRANP